jgi:hypothetical protein
MLAGEAIFQPSVASGYLNVLVMATNGIVYVGNGATISTAGNQSPPLLSSTNNVSMCYLDLATYMNYGGSTSAYLNMTTGAMSTYTTSTGLAPTFCSLNATWRGRLVMLQDANNPQNIYASRMGDAQDMNFAATDPASAWAANFSESGQIGQPVTAFIPFNDDLAIVGCINQVWLIEGDPSDGGSFVLMSDGMGIVGPRAWCTDAQHTLYFVGTSGLYSVRPFWAQYQPPQLLSGQSYDQFFQNLDRNQNNVSLIYDETNKYIHIYVSPRDQSVGTHLIYDTRNGGMWPVEYAPLMGPTCVASYVPGYSARSTDPFGFPIGPTSAIQTIALGGWDGAVYQVDSGQLQDQDVTTFALSGSGTSGGTAINSFITFAPINPNPVGEAILQRVEVDMGEVNPITFISTGLSATQVGAGSTFGSASTGLTGTVDSTNVNFTVNQPIEAVGAGFFVNSTGDPIFADPVSASGTSVTLPHPILSTYTIAGFEIQTVGYVFGYESLASISTTPWNANLTVRAGAVAADVDNDGYSWPTQSSTLYKTLNFNMPNDRRQPTFMARLGGAWFTVTLSNSTDNTMYSFERMFLTFAPGGRNRYQR